MNGWASPKRVSPVFSPKGWDNIAWGNAPGSNGVVFQAESLGHEKMSQPFRLHFLVFAEPGAMPQATLSDPFGVKSRDHAFPNTRSTTQHPRTCGPSPRQWFSTSGLSHPASWSASARIGIRSNAFSA